MTTDLLEALRARREIWIACHRSEDRNSVMRQIHRMILSAASFRVINEARRLAPKTGDGRLELNGMVHHLIDQGFFESQMSAIRRLTDPYPIADEARGRDVCSLVSLLEDMRQHVNLMTRENMFAVEGLEYDLDQAQAKWDAYAKERMAAGETSYSYPVELYPGWCKRRHEEWDFLSGVSEADRSPGDTLKPEVLEFLKSRTLGACESIRLHVDKNIAHAASAGNRQVSGVDQKDIRLREVWDAHATICKIACFVDLQFLTHTVNTCLLVPQFNQLEYIDRPLVATENVPTLLEVWRSYEKETEGWRSWSIAELREEMG